MRRAPETGTLAGGVWAGKFLKTLNVIENGFKILKIFSVNKNY